MKITHVQSKVERDPEYAATLAKKVARLASNPAGLRGPHNEAAWRDLLSEFTSNPEELSRLMEVNSPEERRTWTTTTTTCTLTTTTTAVCTTTTTTTVTTTITATRELPAE